MKLGYFLSCEEWGPSDLLGQAKRAQEAGFHALWISDHFHPWNDTQGHSPFVWSVIGGIAATVPGMPVTTAVTCPTVRTHPAVIAHAAATSAVMLGGNFSLGLGTGEALNEHILGDPWPEAAERREMLEEAIEIIRLLWQGGAKSHRGRHYRVQHARIYDLPDTPPKIIVSGFGPKAVDMAARIGDGFCTVEPDADSVSQFRSAARDGAVVQGGIKVCFGPDEAECKRTVHRLWPNEALPGELAQILPTPEHFEQASQIVTEELATENAPCGPDIDKHVEAIQAYADAGFDELFVNQIGPGQDAFFDAYRTEIVPRFNGS
jgi:G6PDH family F420-dependent oxidoreductase